MLPLLIPRSVIFGNPEKADPQVSPDGSHLAYLAPLDGVLNVWVGDITGEEFRPITHDTDRGIRAYFWAHDAKHVLYLQDAGGDENWRLHKVALKTGTVDDLTPFESVQVQIVARDKRHPSELLIAMNKDDRRLHDVYHLDLRSNALELVAKNPGNVLGWIADTAFHVRAALASTPEGGSELLMRSGPDDDWQSLLVWGPEDAMTSWPLGFTLDGGTLYLVDSRDVNAARLCALALGSGSLEVIAADPEYDVSSVHIHQDTRAIQMVAFTRARLDWEVLDPALAEDIEAIRALNPGDFTVHSRTHDDQIWIVEFVQDTGPVSYYAFDRRTRSGTFLLHTRPDLSAYTLAEMQPITLAARDGLTVHGYLTLPPGVEPKRLPMVLDVHGGPWHRDTWGYDPEAQWLANRGYACLQVNFRGSTGYGKQFLNAGNREWGGKMHDDVVDAVRWAVERGIADPDRVAIYGGSYGGYAALVGATFTPDLFRCAVDIVGPSNLITFIETIPPYWSSYLTMLHERVGNPEGDRHFLLSRSPLTHVDRIRIPLLIAQGANDPRVKQSESEQIVTVMREKGIDHEYMLFPDEGHGFAKPENRLRFYAAAERFLAKHLGGRCEDSDADALSGTVP
ncbi:MAG: S9 family peptidase [Gemmatimonadota bacterium]|nr:S9 family peptidase [Gemmatimonadota bacterium]MDH3366601.1 S9 family peptidase [Gemmatimonadota bacterium]MDH3476873.1 S9 family peptidase [Gemmatimonadota bacterium]MDH3571063.1 S9 family peptidase [Gemmatimonadota bacterium]MDH5548497.1 S9 family peptidase [Gemmatimonadota bacterium]